MTSDDNLVVLFLHNHNGNVTASSSTTFIRGPQVVRTHRLSVQTHKNWGQPVWHDAEQTDRPPNVTHTQICQFIHKYTHSEGEGESSETCFLSLLKWHVKCGGEVSVCAMCVCEWWGDYSGTVSHLLLLIILSWPPVQCLFCHMHSAHTPPRPMHVKNYKHITSHTHTHTCSHIHTCTHSEYEPPGPPGVSMFSRCACVCLYMAEFPLGLFHFVSNWFGLFPRSHCSVVNQTKAHTHAELSLGHQITASCNADHALQCDMASRCWLM